MKTKFLRGNDADTLDSMPAGPIEMQSRFRFISCPECAHQFYWLGDRLPSYCPECGGVIYSKLTSKDNHATLADRRNCRLVIGKD